jgi:hypothetical protein
MAGLLTFGSFNAHLPMHKAQWHRTLSPFTVAGAVTAFTVFPFKTLRYQNTQYSICPNYIFTHLICQHINILLSFCMNHL